MSHRFTRNIVLVRNIEKQRLSTNVQNDILSTNKLDSVRKYPTYIRTGFIYHCLTDNIKSLNHFLYPGDDNDLTFHIDWTKKDPNDPQTINKKPFETIGTGLAVNEKGELYNTALGLVWQNGNLSETKTIEVDGIIFSLEKNSGDNWGIKLTNNLDHDVTYNWYFKHYYGSDGANQSGGLKQSDYIDGNLKVGVQTGFLEADNLMLGYGSAAQNRVIHEVMIIDNGVLSIYNLETILLNVKNVDLKNPYLYSRLQKIQ